MKKSTKALSDFRNFLPDEIGLFLQQDSINEFKSMCRDIWERFLSNKIYIFNFNNEYTWFNLSTQAFRQLHWNY